MDQSSIRIVVADEHFLFRRGISALLGRSAGMQVIDEAATAEAALGAVQTHAPDLALLDAALSGADFDLVRKLRSIRPGTNILVLTNGQSISPERAADAGALGCLSRELPAPEMIEAIRRAANQHGSDALNLSAGSDTAAPAAAPKPPDFRDSLTRREREVMDMVVEGATSREIAAALSLSIKTIEAHKFNLMRKLDVHSRAELIQLALRNHFPAPAFVR